MIWRVLAASLLFLLPGLPAAAAADDAPPAVITPKTISEMSLDDLFAKLKDNPTSVLGARLEQEILRRFAESGSPTADLLLSWAGEAIDAKNYPHALDILDQLIVIKPDFAEAWNKRATVYYMMDNYSASLSDIRQTLALQPRHFGALSGFGMILEALDRKKEAVRALKRALELDPRLDNVKQTLDQLEKETEGPAI